MARKEPLPAMRMRDKEKAAALAGHNSKQVTGISLPAAGAIRLHLRRSGDARHWHHHHHQGEAERASIHQPPVPKARHSEAPPGGGKSERRFPGKSKEGEGASELRADPLPTCCCRLPLPPLERSAYPSGWLSLNYYSSLRRRRACQPVEVAAAWLVLLVRADRVPPPCLLHYHHLCVVPCWP